MRLLHVLAGLMTAVYLPAPGFAEGIAAHEEYIYQIAFSRDGALMATAGGDNTAIIWDVASRRKRHVLKHESAVYTAQISPDGKRVATGSGDGCVALWDTHTGDLLLRTRRHADAVYCLAYSPNGQLLASAGGSTDGGDAVCRISTAADLQPVTELAGHERQVYGLTFSPDGNTLASGSSDKTIRLWNLGSSKARVLRGHTSDVYRSAFSPDGQHLATASQDSTVRLWSVPSGRILHTFKGKPHNPFYTVTFSPDGHTLAAVGDDRRLHLFDSTQLTPRSQQELSKKALYALAFHPAHPFLSTGGEDGQVHFVGLKSKDQE